MEIIFHAHHAMISDELRARAERAVHKAAARLHRTVDAVVRFEEDGPTRRVEIVLNAPRHRPVVAVGEGRELGPALTATAARLQTQVGKAGAPRARARRAVNGDDAAAEGADAGPLDELALLEAAQGDAADDAADDGAVEGAPVGASVRPAAEPT